VGVIRRIGRLLYGEPAVVLFDGNCRLCRGSIRAVRALDMFDQIIPVNALDEEARTEAGAGRLEIDSLIEAMHVVAGDRAWAGFEACRMLAGRVPLLWPVLPFLYIWPIPALGRRVYRWVARRRVCTLPPEGDDTVSLRPGRHERI
jgi:predicted DCC family thiol-disulfide oxidoreductase YuxK